jgi:iron complex outermembrane receptor protein
MLERFVTYNTGPVFIYPNESLQPETGWSGEIGIKQGVKIGEWKGFVDLAAFIMEYDDMMEFSFGLWGPPTDSLFGFGFKSINIGRSQIKGIELSIGGEGKIGQTEITILGSYTYTVPMIDDKNYNYYQDSTGAELSYLITSSDTSGLLKYRYEHLAKLDLNVERNRLNCGLSIRLNSAMKNIDAIFEDPIFNAELGIKDSRERLNGTNTIVDFRVGYLLSENNSMSFNIDNVFNREFLQRPASLGAPRTFSVLYKIKF